MRTILSLFENQRRLGIVGPERFRASSRHGRPREMMGVSRETIEAMAIKWEALKSANTMFSMEPCFGFGHRLRGLRLANAFAPEAGLSDGALEHAVEGLFNHSVRLAGFQVAGVSAG